MALGPAEVELYDRQIRLWGVEAQAKIRDSWILLRRLDRVQFELCKCLVCAGFNLLLDDSRPATPPELEPWLLDSAAVGDTVAQAAAKSMRKINSLTKVEVWSESSPPADVTVSIVKSFSNSPQQSGAVLELKQTDKAHYFMVHDPSHPARCDVVNEVAVDLATASKNWRIEFLKDAMNGIACDRPVPAGVAGVLGGLLAQEIRFIVTGDHSSTWRLCGYNPKVSACMTWNLNKAVKG